MGRIRQDFTGSFPLGHWLSLLQMMFLTSILLKASGQVPPDGFRYASYDVTIPRKLTPRFLEQENQDIKYLLQIKGKNQVVHLRQQRGFVPKHFPIFTYSKKRERQVDYPFIRDDCYYQGFMQGVPLSPVTLSTCSGGLRGLFQLENETYEIEPILNSTTFQHLVYRLEEREGAARMRCGVRDEEKSLQEAMIQNTKDAEFKNAVEENWWTHTRYVKVAIVVDHERYIRFNRNETLVALNILDIIHCANSAYEPLGVQVSLLGLEIWSEYDVINLSDNMEVSLESFTRWRNNNLAKHLPNDVAHLFSYKFYSYSGMAYKSSVCIKDWASAVIQYTSPGLIWVTNTFSHELGHNLGMAHDSQYCDCGLEKCVMYMYQSDSCRFSNCSYQDYFELKDRSCLLIPPDPEKMYKQENCGNKIVEKGEQCDCGSETQCHLDPCCLPNCTLSSGTTCAFGMCCRNCQYRQEGSLCRDKATTCDLPEYCSGTSESCPEDVYMQDGTPCSDGAYCYHGTCITHDVQCRNIFGNEANMADEICFKITNTRGDRFGNCGLRHGIYKKCGLDHILCGRIQCENVITLPSLMEHTTIVQTAVGVHRCWGTDYHTGIGIADFGAVRDGTSCGADKMCLNGECKSVSLHYYANCNAEMCHNRGVCNNYKHCHCDYGWDPPDCLQEGYGGSIDSGPKVHGKALIIAVSVNTCLLAIFAGVGVGVGLYYKYALRFKMGRMSSTINPVEAS